VAPGEQGGVKGLAQGPRVAVCGTVWDLNSELLRPKCNALTTRPQLPKFMFVLFRDSCQRGWRLLYILTAFHRCSDVMKPFLLRFLQDACDSPGMPYQGIAKACQENLKKTFQYGGRVQYPNNMEIKAILAGRSSKRQLFLLPGGIERHLKIKTCSVASDVIEDLCSEMGLQRLEALDEYAVFLKNGEKSDRKLLA
uniref:MyTH4 domain-containing protein n=1 Tax=Cyprinodon variegatus TaxID=28743 RepID=A0A3Q2EKT6_CYPVA